MKVLLTILLIVVVSCNQLASQDFWQYTPVPDSVTKIKDIVISPTGDVLICTNHGIFSSVDDGQSWVHLGNIVTFVGSIAFQNDSIWYTSSGTIFYKTEDYGYTWDTISTYSHNLSGTYIINDSLFFEPCWGGIYKSTDGGVTWNQVLNTSQARAFYEIVEYNGNLYCTSIDFIFSENCGIYKSEDLGDTWNLHSLQHYGCYPIFVDNQNNLLTGIAGAWPSGQLPGLFSTIDPDLGWNALYNQGEVLSIAQDSSNGLFIGLQSDVIQQWGVRYSSDYGNTWNNINSGLSWSTSIEDIEISSNNYAYTLCVHNVRDSIFRSVNPMVTIPEDNVNRKLTRGITLYPNPCTDFLNLSYEGDLGTQTLSIYNMFGERVFTRQFFNNQKPFRYELDVCTFRKGIYVIEILTKSNRYTNTFFKL